MLFLLPPPEVEVVVLFPDLLEEDERNLEPEDREEDDLEEDDRDEEDLDPPRLFPSVKVKNKIQSTNRMDNVLFCEDILINYHGQGFDRQTISLFIKIFSALPTK